MTGSQVDPPQNDARTETRIRPVTREDWKYAVLIMGRILLGFALGAGLAYLAGVCLR